MPTENIREDCFYRLLTGGLVFNQSVQNAYTIHCVDTLPETGEPATNLDQTQGNVYYDVSTGEAYGYVDATLSVGLSVPEGWYDLATLLGGLGFSYAGTITDISDDPFDSQFRLLLQYVNYSHKDGNWTSMKAIGWAGTGPSAEIFNHPSNVASGDCSHAEGHRTHAEGDSSHAEGDYSHAEGDYSHAEGDSSHAEGCSSHAEGYNSHAEGDNSHAEGDNSHAEGWCSHAEGWCSHAKGYSSHAEGYSSHAKGYASHAEGYHSHAEGDNSHAEGWYSHAEGYASHAEGDNSHAEGWYSHAEGSRTHAVGCSQHVQGEYNVTDPEYNPDTPSTRAKYAHIVGNGTVSTRSNAHTLDWSGNAWFAGDVYVGGTGQDDEVTERLAKISDIPSTEGLATESYVNSAVASLVNAAPDTLNTLNELAAALGDDANFATTVTNQMSSKLDVSELPTAVNDALAQAKASGEFDGADGTNGKDGTSATHSWSGTTLTITSASGTSSVDLKGEKGDAGANGKDGHSPVRGTDYWTDADKAEIKSYVDNAILGGAW